MAPVSHMQIAILALECHALPLRHVSSPACKTRSFTFDLHQPWFQTCFIPSFLTMAAAEISIAHITCEMIFLGRIMGVNEGFGCGHKLAGARFTKHVTAGNCKHRFEGIGEAFVASGTYQRQVFSGGIGLSGAEFDRDQTFKRKRMAVRWRGGRAYRREFCRSIRRIVVARWRQGGDPERWKNGF